MTARYHVNFRTRADRVESKKRLTRNGVNKWVTGLDNPKDMLVIVRDPFFGIIVATKDFDDASIQWTFAKANVRAAVAALCTAT